MASPQGRSSQPAAFPADDLFLTFQAALAGRYSLERELGRGGMGIVYLARELRLDRPVAIKLLPPEFTADQALRERFVREARTAAGLSHPHVVPIFAVDEVETFVFYAMAYVEGETLAERVAARGSLPPAEAARILREVAWALAYAHEKGVVHRDVKPENIILETATGRALVSDFGVARRMREGGGGTAIGQIVGTPDFMSPEQASGDVVDGRSDLYALGVVAFFALSGRLPFSGGTAQAVLAQHIAEPAPRLSTVAPGIPAEFADIVDRCLAKDPRERWQTGEQLAEALNAGFEGRRELPVPVRLFRRKVDAHLVIAIVWSGASVFILRILKSLLVQGGLSEAPAMAATSLLAALQAGAVVATAFSPGRRLLKTGYGWQDVALAARGELSRRREEVAFEQRGPATRAGRWAGRLAGLALVLGSAGVAAPFLRPAATIAEDLVALFVAGLLFLGAGAILGLGGRQASVVLARADALLWNGPLGAWYFRCAGLGLRRVVAAAAARPTELVIGTGAAALFEALPIATRKALWDLPDVIRRLEEHAQGARRRIEELERLMAEAAPGRSAAATRRGALVTDLRASREAARQRLRTIILALETIRLGLLRLTAGVGNLESITADMSAARELSEAAERLLDAGREVEELLPGWDGRGR